jgi:hypothetical protein
VLEVIGAGFGRTGTLSLKSALERLGFERCYHMAELGRNPSHAALWSQAHRGEAIDWDALFEGYRASVDWPSCNLWREQLAHFPDAKVLLSLRDSERWYESIMSTIYGFTAASLEAEDETARTRGRWAMEIVWDHVFDGRMDDREHVIGVFEAHNAAVIREVPAEKLLVYMPGDGWEPLCAFLGVDVPDVEYPRLNTTEQFRERALASE